MQKIVIGVLMINVLIGCSKQNEVPDSITKLLYAIVESPNEELYHVQPTEMGIGTDTPDEKEIDASLRHACLSPSEVSENRQLQSSKYKVLCISPYWSEDVL